MNPQLRKKAYSHLVKQKGKVHTLGEVNGEKVYARIDRVGKKDMDLTLSHRGKVYKTKHFFGGPFGFFSPFLFGFLTPFLFGFFGPFGILDKRKK